MGQTTPRQQAPPLHSARRPQPPSTPFEQPQRQPPPGGYMWNSSTTVTLTTRPRLSTIASATSRQRYREWWRTSGLPLDDSREPELQLTWDMSDSEPKALGRLEGWGGDTPESG